MYSGYHYQTVTRDAISYPTHSVRSVASIPNWVDGQAQTAFWYMPEIPEDRAHSLIAHNQPNGAFIVRRSHSLGGVFVLTYHYYGSVRHRMLLSRPDGVCLKGSTLIFPYLSELISYYAYNLAEVECLLVPLNLPGSSMMTYPQQQQQSQYAASVYTQSSAVAQPVRTTEKYVHTRTTSHHTSRHGASYPPAEPSLKRAPSIPDNDVTSLFTFDFILGEPVDEELPMHEMWPRPPESLDIPLDDVVEQWPDPTHLTAPPPLSAPNNNNNRVSMPSINDWESTDDPISTDPRRSVQLSNGSTHTVRDTFREFSTQQNSSQRSFPQMNVLANIDLNGENVALRSNVSPRMVNSLPDQRLSMPSITDWNADSSVTPSRRSPTKRAPTLEHIDEWSPEQGEDWVDESTPQNSRYEQARWESSNLGNMPHPLPQIFETSIIEKVDSSSIASSPSKFLNGSPQALFHESHVVRPPRPIFPPQELPENVADWSVDDVHTFLMRFDYHDLAPVFRGNGIDGALLLLLTPAALSEMGFTAPELHNRLLQQVTRLMTPTLPPADVLKWNIWHTRHSLIVNNLAEVAPYFQQHEIDGPKLLSLSESDLFSLGMPTQEVSRVMRWIEYVYRQSLTVTNNASSNGPTVAGNPPPPLAKDSLPSTPVPVRRWGERHVSDWLSSIQRSQYIPNLRHLSGPELVALRPLDYEELGVPKSDVQFLLDAIARLKDAPINNEEKRRSYAEPSTELRRKFTERKNSSLEPFERLGQRPVSDGTGDTSFTVPRTTEIVVAKTEIPKNRRDSIAQEWSAGDVCMWLLDNKYGHYRNIFTQNGITGLRLLELNEQSLLDMGVDPKDSRTLFNLIQQIINSKEFKRKMQRRKISTDDVLDAVPSTHDGVPPLVSRPSAPANLEGGQRDVPRSTALLQRPSAWELGRKQPEFKIAHKTSVPYNWWQLGSTREQALRHIASASSGAFVIYRDPNSASRFVLSYKVGSQVKDEIIQHSVTPDIIRGGYWLESAPMDVHSDLHQLVDHYSIDGGPLQCTLKVSLVPDPSLSADEPVRVVQEVDVDLAASWCYVGVSPECALQDLLAQPNGAFVVYLDTASDTLILAYKFSEKYFFQNIKWQLTEDEGQWTGFYFQENPSRLFDTLTDLILFYEVKRPEMHCPLNVSHLDFNKRGGDAWRWCMLCVPKARALQELEGAKLGAFVVRSHQRDKSKLILSYVAPGHNNQTQILHESIEIKPGGASLLPQIYFSNSPEHQFDTLQRLLEFYQDTNHPLSYPLYLPSLPRYPVVVLSPNKSPGRRSEAKWSWWQLEASEADALAVLNEKGTGAFVIYTNPKAANSYLLSYKFKGKVITEEISHNVSSKMLKKGYYFNLTNVFDSLHDLVDYHKIAKHQPLYCALRVSIIPSPSLIPLPNTHETKPWYLRGGVSSAVLSELRAAPLGAFVVSRDMAADGRFILYYHSSQGIDEIPIENSPKGYRLVSSTDPGAVFGNLSFLVDYYKSHLCDELGVMLVDETP